MPYRNLYKDSPDLAGIEVYQQPPQDGAPTDYSAYRGKHPGAVYYHFWDGRILWLEYSPEGKIQRKEWLRHDKEQQPDYLNSWEMVDFSKGSDSEFRRHKDPRTPPGHGLYPRVPHQPTQAEQAGASDRDKPPV